ncbi:MAG: chloride channel protein [Kiritimatiellae bacterium]|nr:chloride channel protein [Kiritimatiellia bacterium]
MSTFLAYLRRFPENTRLLVLTCLYGLGAGLAAVAFLKLINLLYACTYVPLARQSVPRFLAGSFLVITVSSLIVGYMLYHYSKDAAGSGIPQLKRAFWKELGFVPWKTVWVKFVAGIISVGGGASLGREGPSVQVGGGVASNLAGAMGVPRQGRRLAAAAGAAAGLAAAFNTPLAATTFVLEEIVGDLNSRLLGSVILAAVTGAFVTFGLIGYQPAFLLPQIDSPTWTMDLVVPFVAALAAMVGMTFQAWTVRLRGRARTMDKVPAWFRPVLGGWVTWVLGCAVFLATGRLGIFSLGYDDLSSALQNMMGWKLAGVLIVAKLLATMACYSFGGCGGIFAPTLFLGGMCGVFVAGIADHWVTLTAADHMILAVVGMSACFGSVVRAPLTALLMVFEMTHQFSVVPGLMLGVLVSQAISRRMARHNFYEAMLEQDGHELVKLRPPRDLESWQNLPVSVIARARPVIASDLSETALKELVARYPYKWFPAVLDGEIKGMISRTAIQAALVEKRPTEIQKAVTASPSQSIRDAATAMVDSPSGMLLIVDPANGALTGLLTLHDLLRAQVAVSE